LSAAAAARAAAAASAPAAPSPPGDAIGDASTAWPRYLIARCCCFVFVK
jgi:hypothetical protein